MEGDRGIGEEVAAVLVALAFVGHFADALRTYGETAQDKAIAQDVARRLGIYCDGLYADFLNRESELRFDSRLLTFDMAEVSQNATAKKLAMATIMRLNVRA